MRSMKTLWLAAMCVLASLCLSAPAHGQGACCLQNGNCVDVASQAACAGMGGAYSGDGSVCADITCIGACCLPDGSCIQATERDCIVVQNGAFRGGGIGCYNGQCADFRGACCMEDGSCTPDIDFSDCEAAGGIWQGYDTTCIPDCNNGACCLPDGTCIANQTIDQCQAAGGSFQGFGSACPGGNCFIECHEEVHSELLAVNFPVQLPKFNDLGGTRVLTKATLEVMCEVNTVNILCNENEDAAFTEGGFSLTLGVQLGIPVVPVSLECINLLADPNGGGNTPTLFCGPNMFFQLQPGQCCDFGATAANSALVFMDSTSQMYVAQGDLDDFTDMGGMPTFTVTLQGTGVFDNPILNADFENDTIGYYKVRVCYEFAPTGACCLADGTCIDNITEDDCNAQNGTYQGDGTPCLPSGACCLPDNSCVVVSETCCDDLGGTFIGGACSPNSGACCLPNGNCIDVNETCCIALGGMFVGGNCGATGACCLPDGSCVQTPAACCPLLNGTFIGGACSPNSGACCLPNGDCIDVNETCCIAQNGTFVGGPCGADGACCLPDGSCVQTPAACCPLLNGTFIGGPCSPNSGACCLPNGDCIDVNETCCIAQNGVFVGGACGADGACCLPDGTCVQTPAACCPLLNGTFIGGPCSPNSGACCLPNGDCVDVNETCCIDLGGTFVGGTCGVQGACCLPNGTCTVEFQACCVLAGGTFAGPGTVCGIQGACCFPDGSCTIEIEACCVINGGNYVGPGTVCGPTGACCLSDGTCLDNQFEACCEAIGGDFQGGGVVCDPNLCDPQDGGCDEKGSLVIFSKVEIRWDDAGNLLQDTFLQLTNDYPAPVSVQMYFINGDPPLAATPNERAHPGWNWVDNKIRLTQDQPTYWSALTGLGGSGPQDPTFSPFTVLDPGFPPGRPDPEVAGERYLRGYIIAWAVDSVNNQEIRWNHLAGIATLLHYRDGYAWEYRTCGIPVVANVGHGQVTGMHPGELHLDGAEYRAAADLLLLNFQAAGSVAWSGPVMVQTTTDVTLHPIDADLRQETDGPVTTKAHYLVWNMNEGKLSGAFRCITCWDQTLLVNYGIPNHFTLLALQTDHGKARIDGLASALCDRDLYGPGGPGTPPDGILDVISQPAALLGLTARFMTVDGGVRHAADGTNMFELGAQDAVIKYDVQQGPPENFDIPSSPEEVDRLIRKLTGQEPGIYPTR